MAAREIHQIYLYLDIVDTLDVRLDDPGKRLGKIGGLSCEKLPSSCPSMPRLSVSLPHMAQSLTEKVRGNLLQLGKCIYSRFGGVPKNHLRAATSLATSGLETRVTNLGAPESWEPLRLRYTVQKCSRRGLCTARFSEQTKSIAYTM